MKILLVEDSRRLQKAIVTGLKKSGYSVDATGDGEEGLWFAESNDYDVIILDIMLPNLDGLSILSRVREKERDVFVLMLTARDTLQDKLAGLKLGADDYLVKPFAFEELLARIQALIRRKYGAKKKSINIKDLEIDLSSRIVFKNGKMLNLLPREYALLEFLALKKGTLVTRTQIEQHIYDEQVAPISNVVDSAICSLRKKIDNPEEPSLIITRRGMGYIIE
jgi:DNA-binding response OmpR family regulator